MPNVMLIIYLVSPQTSHHLIAPSDIFSSALAKKPVEEILPYIPSSADNQLNDIL
jgi:hypothetical protein